MNNKQINDAIASIQELSFYLEEEYENNGGEVTEYTEEMEAKIQSLQTLLSGEGIDSLGRWMKAVEDEITTIKDEMNYLSTKVKAKQNTLAFVKSRINGVMQFLGMDKVKGQNGYSFTRYISTETSVNKDALNSLYKDRVLKLMAEDGIPEWVTFNLTASTTRAMGCEDVPEGLFTTTETPSVKFLKPRKKKEE